MGKGGTMVLPEQHQQPITHGRGLVGATVAVMSIK